MTRIVAVTGLSGVRKTIVERVRVQMPFQHLQAGRLIRDARTSEKQQAPSVDDLRHLDTEENQRVLIHSFRRALNAGNAAIGVA